MAYQLSWPISCQSYPCWKTLVILLYNICLGFLVTLCALTSCHVAISKQGSTIRALGYNRCVIGRRPRDENNVVKFRQRAENCNWAWDTQPIRGVSDELAWRCKRWHPLTPWRRYGTRKSPLPEYIFFSICLSNINKLWVLFENKTRDIFF